MKNPPNNKPIKIYFFIYIFFISTTFANQDYFLDIPDDGTREVAASTAVFQEHYLKSVDYTFNVSTPGFIKKSVTNVRLFDEPDGKHVISAKYSYKWLEGPQYETGDDLHFCINGQNRSFFKVLLTENLIAYTRDGRFRVDSQNRLVTLSGNYPVLGREGVLTLPGRGHYTINRLGGFFVDDTLVDYFDIVMFKSFEQMNKYLHNVNGSFFILDYPIDEETENPQYNVLQGVITQSNSYKSYDSWFYKTSHDAAVTSAGKLITTRKMLFNAIP